MAEIVTIRRREAKAKYRRQAEGKTEKEKNTRTDSSIFLLISSARLAVAESRLSIFNAIMSRRV